MPVHFCICTVGEHLSLISVLGSYSISQWRKHSSGVKGLGRLKTKCAAALSQDERLNKWLNSLNPLKGKQSHGEEGNWLVQNNTITPLHCFRHLLQTLNTNVYCIDSAVSFSSTKNSTSYGFCQSETFSYHVPFHVP